LNGGVNGKNTNKVSHGAQLLTFSFETAPFFATLAILSATATLIPNPTRSFSPKNLPATKSLSALSQFRYIIAIALRPPALLPTATHSQTSEPANDHH
jgi:hypothetical protein